MAPLLQELSVEILIEIFGHTSPTTLGNLRLTCRKIKSIFDSNSYNNAIKHEVKTWYPHYDHHTFCHLVRTPLANRESRAHQRSLTSSIIMENFIINPDSGPVEDTIAKLYDGICAVAFMFDEIHFSGYNVHAAYHSRVNQGTTFNRDLDLRPDTVQVHIGMEALIDTVQWAVGSTNVIPGGIETQQYSARVMMDRNRIWDRLLNGRMELILRLLRAPSKAAAFHELMGPNPWHVATCTCGSLFVPPF